MNIFQALKVKNRLVGEVNSLQAILQRENCRREGSTSKVDREKLYKDYAAKQAELALLKSLIQEANIGILPDINVISEFKSRLAFLDTLDTRNGIFAEHTGYGSSVVRDITYESFIDNEKRDKMKKELQDEINEIQDRIDNYNAVTQVKGTEQVPL